MKKINMVQPILSTIAFFIKLQQPKLCIIASSNYCKKPPKLVAYPLSLRRRFRKLERGKRLKWIAIHKLSIALKWCPKITYVLMHL